VRQTTFFIHCADLQVSYSAAGRNRLWVQDSICVQYDHKLVLAEAYEAHNVSSSHSFLHLGVTSALSGYWQLGSACCTS